MAGLVGLVIQILREPLARIQNAVTRLVQVETAFTSFIWELNLNGTYIQSQYVAEGVLKDEHIARTVGRIESAMHLAMDLVARYAEDGTIASIPRLSAIFPIVRGRRREDHAARAIPEAAGAQRAPAPGSSPSITCRWPPSTRCGRRTASSSTCLRMRWRCGPHRHRLGRRCWWTERSTNALPLTLLEPLPESNGAGPEAAKKRRRATANA